jgi:hypothetical protein
VYLLSCNNNKNDDERRHRRRSSSGCHVAERDVAPWARRCRRAALVWCRCGRVVVHHLRPLRWPSHHAATSLAVAVVGYRRPALVPRRPFGCHVTDSDVAPRCDA